MDLTTIALLIIGALLALNLIVSLRKSNNLPVIDQELMTSKLSDALGQRFQGVQESLLNTNEERIKNAENSIAQQQSASFRAINEMVKPLTDSLKGFDTYVKEIEKSREGAYSKLDQQVEGTMSLLNSLGIVTANLEKTLSSNQARGSWGELQLHRIIEHVGLEKHYSYDEQKGIQGEAKGRPDTQVKLPGGKLLYIDSKVPLSAYRQAIETNDESIRAAKMAEHAKDVKKHVDELARRDYAKDSHALDVVIMFIPIEACLFAAMTEDQSLLEYAAQKKIVLTAPSSLVAVLTNIATSWMQFEQWQNADGIVKHASELHDRMGVLLRHIASLRKNLNSTVESFNEVIGSLDGKVLPKTREIEKLARLSPHKHDLETLDADLRISRHENLELEDK